MNFVNFISCLSPVLCVFEMDIFQCILVGTYNDKYPHSNIRDPLQLKATLATITVRLLTLKRNFFLGHIIAAGYQSGDIDLWQVSTKSRIISLVDHKG